MITREWGLVRAWRSNSTCRGAVGWSGKRVSGRLQRGDDVERPPCALRTIVLRSVRMHVARRRAKYWCTVR